ALRAPPPAALCTLSLTTLFRSARVGQRARHVGADPRGRRPHLARLRRRARELRAARRARARDPAVRARRVRPCLARAPAPAPRRSEEHTSELPSLTNLVCRLLL